MYYQSGIIETDISDHHSTYIIIPEVSLNSDLETNTIDYRLMNHLRKRKFNYDLYHSDIAEALDDNNAKTACEHFFSRFQNNYDQSFPIKSKKLTYKDILKPWINDISIKRIKIRDNLKKLARKKLIKRKI